jgi:hypothetical protein
MSSIPLLDVKAWFHEGASRFEQWLNPVTGVFEDMPPEKGLTFIQASREKNGLRYQLPPSTRLFLVPLGSIVPERQLALVRPSGHRSNQTP